MPDTITPKIGLVRVALGAKPWKKQEDFNWLLLDTLVGGLEDGSVPAGVANSVSLTALNGLVATFTGDLTSIGNISDGAIIEVLVDHSVSDGILDIPCAPIANCSVSNVPILYLANRASSLDNTEYGGKFRLRIENQSGSTVAGSTITWKRKGLKFS